MRKLESKLLDVRIEVVTTSFVASGRPDGVHDLGRLLENLNNPAVTRHVEMTDAAVRPLYRAAHQVRLDAPLLVRRDEIIFANFEGPHFNRGGVRPAQIDTPALLLAPPFQIQGTVGLPPGSDSTQALRGLVAGFFVVRNANVYDADGNALGEGEQIVVNGAAVQMTAATKRHIDVSSAAAPADALTPVAAIGDDESASEAYPQQRAA